ncbi:MAG: acetate/propionate family kinase [Roseateles depolymerans]|uniref:Acetate kinase n=1 Tax=Roseateles depolymerans TaxID=76731 RepID=A0A2W5DIA4_9BURK|nr:MAG: acetate/propionate family kinase [Roseateles depolymerans]
MSAPLDAGLWLALNAGSSSIKLAIYRLSHHELTPVARGHVDLRRQPLRLLLAHGEQHSELPLEAPVTESLDEVLEALLAQLEAHESLGELAGAGHRVVHGGLHFTGPARVDDAVLAELEALVPLAPLHQGHSLKLVRALRRQRPALAQTVSFDTAFHTSQSDLVRRFALPRALHDQGVRRYGFHGLSYSYIAAELARRHPQLASGRVVAAHLGSGASLCAMQGGRSVDSSMGFSTLDGVPMATRSGALDAGVVLYLQRAQGLSTAEVEDLLYHRSGLLGVSGLSADIRTLEASPEPAAREALELFALRCAGEVGRLATSLQGLDALVFTAGIGEHDARLRAMVCSRLAWLGLELDEAANLAHAERISREDSGVAVHVIPTDEERVIAEQARALLARQTA